MSFGDRLFLSFDRRSNKYILTICHKNYRVKLAKSEEKYAFTSCFQSVTTT